MKTIGILVLFIYSQLISFGQLIESFTGGDPLSTGPGSSGFDFSVTQNETVKFLGIFDSDPASPGLFSSHSVGLWDASTHALLASVSIPSQGAVKVGDFFYTMLTAPLELSAGHSYVLAASYADNDFDFAQGNITSLTTQAGNVMGNARLSTGSLFEFPDLTVTGANQGFVGPNAIFTAVPEPSSTLAVALALALGAAGAGLRKAKPPSELTHAKRRQPLIESPQQAPATNRPPVTPGNTNGNRPIVPPGLQNYATP